MSQNEHQTNTTDKTPDGKTPAKLDPNGNTTSTRDVPQEGSIVGASQPQQGTWSAPKGGAVVAPPARGHVEKPLENPDTKTNEK
jgi:hypothetical protein